MKLKYLSVATIGLSLMSVSLANASLTQYLPKPSEDSIPDVFAHLYGGSFSATDNNYTNGSITAWRVSDITDNTWDNATYQAKLIARFSGYTQSFGTYSPRTGFHEKLEADDTLGFLDHADEVPITLNRGFCWGRNGNSGLQTSKISNNVDGRDHMLTFRIKGLPESEPVWMLFWEDLNLSPDLAKHRSTSDFNDLVVEVRAGLGQAGPGPVSVPLPPAMAASALTLGLGVLLRIKRRIKH